jgi:hypothetical protein
MATGNKYAHIYRTPVKTCSRCGEIKPTSSEFPANKHMKDGLSSWCRFCHNEATRRSKARRRHS